jgi:hypothetical protein
MIEMLRRPRRKKALMPSRLPSPALLVASLALFISLGGTGYGAGYLQASHAARATQAPLTAARVRAIAKAEATLVFNNLAKHAHVASATTAITAGTAMTATHALTADSATTATTATTATNATHATNADNASLAAVSSSIASVAYQVDPSAGPETVPACAANPCTPEDVVSTPAIAVCPAGTVAIGGGGFSPDDGVELSGSFPTSYPPVGPFASTPNAWEVYVDNYLPVGTTVNYYAVCTSAKSTGN